MNITALRYAIAITQMGSFNKAAQYLYVSQPTLSRAIKELEDQIGIELFLRTNQGVRLTYDGQQFIDKARHLLEEIDQLEGEYFNRDKNKHYSLLVATRRCTAVIHAFTTFYQRFCTGREMVNLVIQEESGDKIMNMICGGLYELGVFHYTSDQEEHLNRNCREMNLEMHLLERSPVCAQVRWDHPLASQESVKAEDLVPYPHIVYANEDLTGIHFCSDISFYNPTILKKRIVIQDRGTLRQVINDTDGYYFGCDYSRFPFAADLNRRWLPVEGVDFTINTAWAVRSGHKLTQAEQDFISVLEEVFTDPKE